VVVGLAALYVGAGFIVVIVPLVAVVMNVVESVVEA